MALYCIKRPEDQQTEDQVGLLVFWSSRLWSYRL
jgi:hypothetical protein